MRFTHRLSTSLFAALVFTTATAQNRGLPSLSDLQQLKFADSAAIQVAGAPSYSDLKTAASSFETYHEGIKRIAASKEAPTPRGQAETDFYHSVVSAVPFILSVEQVENNAITAASEGAGVILAPSGLVITAFHVVRCSFEKNFDPIVFLKPPGALEVRKEYGFATKVVWYNETKDLALLQFRENPTVQLVGLSLSDFSNVDVGETIYVIGHPGGLRNVWSYGSGTISQVRSNYPADVDECGSRQHLQADMLQIQTGINPGNSGGPVLDKDGKVLGVVSFGSGENLHFAVAAPEISAFIARRSMRQISRGQETPPAKFATAKTADGQKVVRVQYPDRTAYFLLKTDGKLAGLVIPAVGGGVVKAWEPAANGGFNQWQASFSDGTNVQATTKDGSPAKLSVQ